MYLVPAPADERLRPAPKSTKRRRKSCEACRIAKIACTRERPVCGQCQLRKYACVYDETKTQEDDSEVESRVAAFFGEHNIAGATRIDANGRRNEASTPVLSMNSSVRDSSPPYNRRNLNLGRSFTIHQLVEAYFNQVYPTAWFVRGRVTSCAKLGPRHLLESATL